MAPAEHPYDTLLDAYARMSMPRDLLLCMLWLAGALCTIYVPYLNESFLRILFGIPLVLFIPGYALIAALFPAARDIDGIERIALSFGLSIALVPLTGLILNYTPFGIRLDPIVVSLSLLTIGLCLLAVYRRARLPPEERFVVPFRKLQQGIRDEFFLKEEKSSRTDRILSIILLIAIIAAVTTTVYVIVVPKEGEKFTEFFILGENQKAADYPTSLLVSTNSSLFIGIGNHEYRTVNYIVEPYLLKMTFNEKTNTTTLNSMTPLETFAISVPHNQTVIRPYAFSPATTGPNRLELLLFKDTVPNPQVTGMERINASYRDLHLWVTVS
ncbi:MAG: DUF1616 domain-containing protein [Methanoregula sp.]